VVVVVHGRESPLAVQPLTQSEALSIPEGMAILSVLLAEVEVPQDLTATGRPVPARFIMLAVLEITAWAEALVLGESHQLVR
jgi:hypothetical protein